MGEVLTEGCPLDVFARASQVVIAVQGRPSFSSAPRRHLEVGQHPRLQRLLPSPPQLGARPGGARPSVFALIRVLSGDFPFTLRRGPQ